MQAAGNGCMERNNQVDDDLARGERSKLEPRRKMRPRPHSQDRGVEASLRSPKSDHIDEVGVRSAERGRRCCRHRDAQVAGSGTQSNNHERQPAEHGRFAMRSAPTTRSSQLDVPTAPLSTSVRRKRPSPPPISTAPSAGRRPALVIARFRRRLDAARVAGVRRLAELAVTEPLTALRNHRAFREDLVTSMHQVGRNGTR